MIETKILISSDNYIAQFDRSYEKKREDQVGLIVAAVLIFLVFCNALRIMNKPENVAKRKEQKRLMEEKKLELKKAYIKKVKKDPLINISSDEYFEVHMQRLQKYGKSQYQGMTYYMGSKGGIYTLSASGSRNYKY
ncbi:hypothetical protein [Prochlorococcus marinus]|uniref:Uncharacterized protein n=1 Tax=Prochlorococcus marinus str. GP2 TaxID=59925 RepID=A0A0A1ZKQ4_PROMR|nr:hypothetical protein [Prochlorococcus marinus]KGF89071.1 hypothetical protein EU91_0017 [Prochlorococcus marinus str. GP2]